MLLDFNLHRTAQDIIRFFLKLKARSCWKNSRYSLEKGIMKCGPSEKLVAIHLKHSILLMLSTESNQKQRRRKMERMGERRGLGWWGVMTIIMPWLMHLHSFVEKGKEKRRNKRKMAGCKIRVQSQDLNLLPFGIELLLDGPDLLKPTISNKTNKIS